MAKASEKYEVMYIINPNLSEEETAAVVEKFKALVEANGTLDEIEEMGKRKLAYEINYISYHRRHPASSDHHARGIRRDTCSIISRSWAALPAIRSSG